MSAEGVEYVAKPGPALRIRNFDELGGPEEVKLGTREAKRLEYIRDQWIKDVRCRVFVDPKDGTVYAIPVYGRNGEEEKA